MTPVLSLNSVRKSFGTDVVLQDIQLEVNNHSVTVLIGASGSGKSTLLRCINLLETIDDGEIWLSESEITAINYDQDSARKRMGIVFQNFNLFPHLSVLDNITLAPTIVHGVQKITAQERAMELLSRFGLEVKANEFPDRLSGGQQQRVAILRAIATLPEILLLDEVTSALDPVLVAEVLQLVSELREDGMTMVVATHEMGFARRVADQVGFLHHGRLLELGTAEQILDNPQTPELKTFLKSVREAGRL
jgi:polar amino acid transport system ATP-binding protein